MNIKLNKDYNIENISGNTNFTQGNNNFDKIEVAILKSAVSQDNCLPSLSFTLPNCRQVGDFLHEETKEDSDNYIFVFSISDNVLKNQGSLLVTVSINFYNDENEIVKKKKISFQANVLKGTLATNDFYIIGDGTDMYDSVKNNYDAINKRVDLFNNRISNYDFQFASLNWANESNSSKLNEVDSNIAVIENRIDENDKEIESINNDISLIDNSIETINQDIDSIDNAIIEINDELDTLQTKMEPITTLEIEAL